MMKDFVLELIICMCVFCWTFVTDNAIQPSNDPLEVPVGPVTSLRSSKKLSMDFFKIHGLMWTSRGFVIIKSKP